MAVSASAWQRFADEGAFFVAHIRLYADVLLYSTALSTLSPNQVCWLLGTSVQKIGTWHLMERASLPIM